MTRWAAGRLGAQLGTLLRLMVRALPLLLLFVVFLFLTPELWQVAASLNGPYLALAIGLFVTLGVVFVVAHMPDEVGRLGRFDDAEELQRLVGSTPAATLPYSEGACETAPMSRRQWGNVGLVLLVSQRLQVLCVSIMIGAFLVAFGLIVITPETGTSWVGRDVNLLFDGILWGRSFALTAELLQVSAFLAAVSGFSFTLSLLTDATYRDGFLHDVVFEIRQALAVRTVYLRALAGGRD